MFLTHRAADMLGDSLTLAALSDARPLDAKPNYPYPTLIRAAILGSPRQALTLQGIYDALAGRYQWFRDHWQDRAWKVRDRLPVRSTIMVIVPASYCIELDPPQSVSEQAVPPHGKAPAGAR